MSRRTRLIAVVLVIALAAVAASRALVQNSSSSSEDSSARAASVERGRTTIGRHGVFEPSFRWRRSGYANPWEEVTLSVAFRSPSGRRHAVGGFLHGHNRWKARFAPAQLGRWTWRARIGDRRHAARFSGAFRVVPSRRRGFVRQSPVNRFRFTFADASPYYPLGVGDCLLDVDRSGSPLDNWGLDGGFRGGRHENGRIVGMKHYLTTYARAGVNLFRWSVDNCSFGLYRTIAGAGNVYRAREGRWGDQLVQALRRHGLRTYMTIFGAKPPFATGGSRRDMRAVKRYVKYVVDRYAAYVDFWELMNEARAADGWYSEVARYLRRIDPYRHPISTSFERPDLRAIDISSPHLYARESESDSDSLVWQRMAAWKMPGKPVVVGEQGNAVQNWDPRSGLRMRIRAWTAFFAEGTLIFWNSSFAKDYRNPVAANIYLGPVERRYLKILQGFTAAFDRRAAISSLDVSGRARVRGYALRGPHAYAAYLHAYTNHTTPTSGVRVTIAPRAAGRAVWISPSTGETLARRRVRAGRQQLEVPAFTTDVALKIR